MLRELNRCWYLTSTTHIEWRKGLGHKEGADVILSSCITWSCITSSCSPCLYWWEQYTCSRVDTDFFLCWSICSITMIATIEGRKRLDIPATLEEYSNMAGNTPSDYVLSCCDTTSVLCRIGILYQHHSKCWNLITVGELVYICTCQIFCSTASLVACYMVTVLYGMKMVCFKEWTDKMKNCKINFAPRLSVLSHANE